MEDHIRVQYFVGTPIRFMSGNDYVMAGGRKYTAKDLKELGKDEFQLNEGENFEILSVEINGEEFKLNESEGVLKTSHKDGLNYINR